MLSVQSVNFRPAFGSYYPKYGEVKDVDYEVVDDMPLDEYYSKEAYENDKSALEKQLEEINAVVENTEVPKPIRAVGKLATIGLGAALGFAGLKYGTQGVISKIIRPGVRRIKALGEKKFVKNIFSKSQELLAELKNSKLGVKTNEFLTGLNNKYKDTKFSQKLSNLCAGIKENEYYKSAVAKGAQLKEQVAKWATADNLEKGTSNLFAVSGGVTGGVSALQEVTKD